jgi:hypothetical protein
MSESFPLLDPDNNENLHKEVAALVHEKLQKVLASYGFEHDLLGLDPPETIGEMHRRMDEVDKLLVSSNFERRLNEVCFFREDNNVRQS